MQPTVAVTPTTKGETHFSAAEWGLTATTAIIWGSSFLLNRIGIESFGAGLVPVMRIAFGLLVLGLFPASRRPIDRRDWRIVILLGVLWMAGPFLLIALAERTVPTAIAGMINGGVPLTSAIAAAAWHRRAPSVRRAFALLIGLVGVSVIALAASHNAHGPAGPGGIVALLVSIAFQGVAANLAAPLQRRYGALTLLVRVQAVALLVSVPYGLVTLQTAKFSWAAFGCMFLLGSLSTGLAFVAAAVLVGRTDATRGTIGIFLTAIVATLIGVIVRHEELPLRVLFGAALVLAGAILTSRPEPRRVMVAAPARERSESRH